MGVEILYQDRGPTTFYKLPSYGMQLEFWLCVVSEGIFYDLFSVVCIFVALDSCENLGVRSGWVRPINSKSAAEEESRRNVM